MKNFLTVLFLLGLFSTFCVFVMFNSKSKTVLNIISPVKIGVDLNNSKSAERNETVCVEGVETFLLEPDEEFINTYSKSLKLSKIDIISLGYLAQEFAQKTLTNEKVSLKFSGKITPECKYADVKINGLDYATMLYNSGFALKNGKVGAPEKFKKNLENARKLNLVILNHHSGKFHTLDCPYGNAAHDRVVIPAKQLPDDVKPCKFCHNSVSQSPKKLKYKKDIDIFSVPKIIQPPLVVADGAIKVHYTDFTKTLKPSKACTTQVCREFTGLINGANESIDIAAYGYDEIPDITSALKRAKSRGVKIRFIYDSNFDPSRNHYKDNSIIATLADIHRSDVTESKTQSNMLMHNKFVIFDRSIVWTGSMNLSRTGTSGYDVNDIVIVKSKEVANLYTHEFEQMLGGKFHTKKEKLNLNNKFMIGDSLVEVYFSPKYHTSTRIIELIKSAKKYIYIPAFLITHTEISNELVAAKNRGVDVRIIIDANSTGTRNSKHALLRKSGILLKTENYAGKLHSKTIIIDDEYLITGSMNFSNSGENKNDENLLVIKNSKIAKAHKAFFLYLWTMIPNKYLKYNAKPESTESIGSCTDGVDNNFNGKIDSQEELCRGK